MSTIMSTKIPTWLAVSITAAIFATIVMLSNKPSPKSPQSVPQMAITSSDWELVRTQGMMKLVYIVRAKENDRAVYQNAIGSLCKAGDYCYISFWSTRKMVPLRWPMSEAEANAQVGSYTHNPSTGFDEFLLTCRIEKDPNKCF